MNQARKRILYAQQGRAMQFMRAHAYNAFGGTDPRDLGICAFRAKLDHAQFYYHYIRAHTSSALAVP